MTLFTVLQPAKLSGLDLRNRFVRSATFDAMADDAGAVTDRSLTLYSDLAAGGVGLIVTGYAFVSKQGQTRRQQYGIHCDETIPGLRDLTQVVHQQGGKIAVQIVHGGGRSHYRGGEKKVGIAPSAVEGNQPAREMTEDEIEGVLVELTAAAVRAREAGFDGVQFHGAHGFLFSQFLSPLTNRRQDRWGGNAENRRRFHLEAVRQVKAAVGPDFPVMIKLGVMDDSDGGATLDEGIAALKAMIAVGLDAVEISAGVSGGRLAAVRVVNEDVTEDVYFRERTARGKRAVDIPVMMVGGIRQLATAEEIVASGDADFVSLCRPLIRQPDLINQWASGDDRRSTCLSCHKCHTVIDRYEPLECGEDRRIRDEGCGHEDYSK